jgi:hypothetical protein
MSGSINTEGGSAVVAGFSLNAVCKIDSAPTFIT